MALTQLCDIRTFLRSSSSSNNLFQISVITMLSIVLECQNVISLKTQ